MKMFLDESNETSLFLSLRRHDLCPPWSLCPTPELPAEEGKCWSTHFYRTCRLEDTWFRPRGEDRHEYSQKGCDHKADDITLNAPNISQPNLLNLYFFRIQALCKSFAQRYILAYLSNCIHVMCEASVDLSRFVGLVQVRASGSWSLSSLRTCSSGSCCWPPASLL